MIIIPSNVASAPSDPNWSNTTLMLKTIATPGATNSAFYDDGPNKFVPTRVGDVTQGALSPYIPSGYWSAYFDGTNDYVQAPASALFNLESTDFTWEVWVNSRQTTNSWVTGYYAPNPTSGAVIGQILVISSGTWAFDLIEPNGADTLYSLGTTTQISDGLWHHLAVTRSGNTIRTFRDGTLVTTTARTTAVNSPTGGPVFRAGGNAGTYEAGYAGHLSNMRLIKGTALYTASFTPLTSPLTAVANTSLLMLQDNRFIDRSTNNFAITKAGDVAVSRFSPFGVQVPVTTNLASTGSVAFDGTSNYLTIADHSALEFGSQNLTWEMWVSTTSADQYDTLMSRTPGAFSAGMWSLMMNFASATSGDIALYIGDFSSGAPLMNTIGVNIRDSAWHHIAVVRNGSAWAIYVDGVSRATATWAGTMTDISGNVYVGGDQTYTRLFSGFISNLRVLKGVAAYTAAFTPPTSPLTAITGTSLLTCQDAVTVTDASTNNFTVTRVGNAAASEVSPFKRATAQYGGSGYFDGTDYLTVPSNTACDFSTGNFCIEGWINPGVVTGGDRCLWDTRANAADAGMVLFIDTNGKLSTYTSNAVRITSTGTLVANTWQHIALVRSSGVLAFYINGTQSGTLSYSTAITCPGRASIAVRFDNAATYTGHLSNFRVVKGTAVYTANFTPPSAPVTAISGTSLLLNFDNAGAWDATGASNFITLGDTKTATSPVKYATSSVVVDGTADYLYQPGTPLGLSTSDFTVEGWIYPTTIAGSARVIFDGRPLSTQGVYPTIYLTAGGVLGFFVNNADRISGGSVLVNNWYHFALCRSGTSTRLFLNGTQVGSTYTDTNNYLSALNRPLFGQNGFANDSHFAGNLEDFRVTRAARYTANFTAPTAAFPTQ